MTHRKPLELFNQITTVNRWFLNLLGIDVFIPEYRFHTATFMSMFLTGVFIAFSVYDMYWFRADNFKFSFAFVTLFYAFLGVTRMGYYVTVPGTYQKIIMECRKTYTLESSERAVEVQYKYTRLLKHCVIFYSICYAGGNLLAGLIPLAIYWWTGTKVLPFGVIVPFTDPESAEGYQLNYLFQASYIAWMPAGLTSTQNMYFALVFNICIQYEILQLKLEDLDNLIKVSADYSTIQQKLVEIIHCQQHLNEFVSDIEGIFAVQMFFEISFFALQIIVVLFVEHVGFWLIGYLAIFVATFQMLVCCVLGTLISIQNDNFAEAIYSVRWHQLRIPEQKVVKFMLAQAQESQLLTYGGILPLDMNLFVSVYKKIYSVFMMLQNV